MYHRCTTSASPLPHGRRPHGVPSHSAAVTGGPDRAYWPAAGRWGGCSGMYSQRRSSPLFTGQRLSGQAAGAVTCSLPCSSFCSCCEDIIGGIGGFVKPYSSVRLNSSAADSSSSAPSSMVGSHHAHPRGPHLRPADAAQALRRPGFYHRAGRPGAVLAAARRRDTAGRAGLRHPPVYRRVCRDGISHIP